MMKRVERPRNEVRVMRLATGELGFVQFEEDGDWRWCAKLYGKNWKGLQQHAREINEALEKPVVNLEELDSMYMDNTLVRLDELMTLVRHENKQQVLKWGVRKATAFEWMTYLTKEAGELAEAVAKHEYSKETDTQKKPKKKAIVNEAIQVATVALKIAEIYLEFVEENDGT